MGRNMGLAFTAMMLAIHPSFAEGRTRIYRETTFRHATYLGANPYRKASRKKKKARKAQKLARRKNR